MNRYEFENLISDYLEGDLPYSKRKEFELYLQRDEDARSLLRTIEKTINQMKKVNKISTSEHFNSRLLSKVKVKTPLIIKDKSHFLGFTPFYGSVFSCLFVAVSIIAYSLIAPGANYSSNIGYGMKSNELLDKVAKPQSFNDNNSFTSNSSSKTDSLDAKDKEYETKKTDKIKFVNY